MRRKEICPVCKGTGKEIHKHIGNDGEEHEKEIFCEFCDGTGSIKNESQHCSEDNYFNHERHLGRDFRSIFGDFEDFDDEIY